MSAKGTVCVSSRPRRNCRATPAEGRQPGRYRPLASPSRSAALNPQLSVISTKCWPRSRHRRPEVTRARGLYIDSAAGPVVHGDPRKLSVSLLSGDSGVAEILTPMTDRKGPADIAPQRRAAMTFDNEATTQRRGVAACERQPPRSLTLLRSSRIGFGARIGPTNGVRPRDP